jgi:hypothetical protein
MFPFLLILEKTSDLSTPGEAIQIRGRIVTNDIIYQMQDYETKRQEFLGAMGCPE